MQHRKNIFFNASLFLNCLLLFLLLFENRLSIPIWLQVAGRMHPMVLHFPLVLVVLYALAVLFFPAKKSVAGDTYQSIADLLLILAAFSSAVTALAGLFLSKEEGYDAEALQWHKWSGVTVSVFTLAWYYFRKQVQTKRILSFSTSVLALCLIIFAGHQGAGITHGQNFLLVPILPEKRQPAVSPEEAEVYVHMVRPILENKCMSCHNSKKAKGELIMETEALLLKGGKHGDLWDSTAPDLGLMLRRIHLPLEQKKHMPPQGKPQLTGEEIEILTLWIRKGADFKLKVVDLPQDDTLGLIAHKILRAAEIAEYDFDEADPATIKELNTINRVVTAEAVESPALAVSFFHSQLFSLDQLKELSKIKKQIVSLDLSKMPVKDADLNLVSGFENLRRLNLNFTGITGAGLQELKKLKFLRSLSLSGTQVTATHLIQLQNLPQLKTIYTWNTPIAAADMEKLQQQVKTIRFETGFKGDTVVMKLSPPVVQNEKSILTEPTPLQLKHYISGTIIRFTTDGSEPDSLQSPVFKEGEMINSSVFIRAKAYKPGWISSDIMEANFYKRTYTPDTIMLLLPPDPEYPGEGKMLVDLEKGETNFRLGNWLAWRKTRMETLMQFAQPVTMRNISLSILLDVGSYIMPPSSIEIWGGNDTKKMKLLSRITPQQPTRVEPASLGGLQCKFEPVTLKYLKVIATPVAKLPAWHPGKGDKAWVFIDEVLVN
ncbi:MAG TPA: DUF2231 domain-containing protein [Chitinophagaceae bacterium]|nr:DUF2231 domain-containing protein [Chitinophagaceae bacterium]